jgi:phage gpG-like protein
MDMTTIVVQQLEPAQNPDSGDAPQITARRFVSFENDNDKEIADAIRDALRGTLRQR